MTLWEKGYGFDAVSDRQLAAATVNERAVILGGNRYRTVVVPGCRLMPPATMRKLVELAKGGARIVFHGSLPTDVPGLNDLEKRRAELKEQIAAINDVPPPEGDGDAELGRDRYIGKGKVIIGGELEVVLQRLVAYPVENGEPMAQFGLRCVRRALKDGHFYFIVNRGDKPVDRWVPLGSLSATIVFMDPLVDERKGRAAVRNLIDSDNEIYLQLQPGEAIVVRTIFDREIAVKPWPYTRPAGEPRPLAGAWTVTFIDGGPFLPAEFVTSSLGSWTLRPDPETKRFAGTARYTMTFDRPAGDADDWLLDLGRVCESARVKMNGQEVATLFAPPYRVSIGKWLRPQGNTLEIDVTNLAANRVRDLDRRKVNWKYFYDANLASHPDARRRGVLDASNWPVRDSGLLGPVTLTPLKLLTPTQERRQ
jgi:hypothetical protein